jgi:DNA-binding PadR family transcriptional regulator
MSDNSQASVIKTTIERMVIDFLDVFIMCELRDGSLGGYDILNHIGDMFQVRVSPGTVYSTIYSMERKGLIECELNGKKRTCRLTKKGTETIDAIQSSKQIKSILLSLLNRQTKT